MKIEGLNEGHVVKAIPHDQEIVTAFHDIFSDPANLVYYYHNPKVMFLFNKMRDILGCGVSFGGLVVPDWQSVVSFIEMGGMAGGSPDPEIVAAFHDILRNPAMLVYYSEHPKLMPLINKMREFLGCEITLREVAPLAA